MKSMRSPVLLAGLYVLLFCSETFSQGAPPANVNVADIRSGTLSPTQEFKGTVYFKEVSNVASEVTGKVIEVLFEEGDRLKQGAPMVRLDDALLKADLDRLNAEVEAAEARLEQEEARYERTRQLREREVTSPQEYDDIRFTVEALKYRLSAAKAQVLRLEEEIKRKTITAPFDGEVLVRQSELGDWKEEGDPIAVFARDHLYDVVVQIPERVLPFLDFDRNMTMTVLDQQIEGRLVRGSPRGDPATRTFPIKIRVKDVDWLLEGMSALVDIPTGGTTDCLIVPRDSVLVEGRQMALYTVKDGQAQRHVVETIGAKGADLMGVKSETLREGMQVIVKGQERVRDGQPVNIPSE